MRYGGSRLSDQDVLRFLPVLIGDEILELNGESMAGLTHQDALQKFKQAKKGLLTLTVRTRLTAPPSLGSHLSPPLCRSLSSSTCVTKDCGPLVLDSPEAAAGTAKPSYRVMVEVSLQKGRGAASRGDLPPASPTL
ncbi:Pro-interleukin-16 [Camelus dromedarius]|uniref:Pro-interleukin-16 n=1 Tax=Camelus dromedarius TaxID=9838 RepID=A0A5N4CE28_CAMDR|nr:Pro-interleukin-16 [Camelus dromedarius]